MLDLRPIIALTLIFFAACGQKTEVASPVPAAPEQTKPTSPSIKSDVLNIASKELAKCGGTSNQIQRLACYDELANKYGQLPSITNTTSEGKGMWTTSTDTDPLTDKKVHRAKLKAQEGRGRFGDEITLHIRCKDGQTEGYINWATFLGSDGISVTSRIDKMQAEKSSWSVSTDHKASFMPQTVPILKKFIGASNYVVNLTPYGENPITAIFDISGSEAAFKDIRQACKW